MVTGYSYFASQGYMEMKHGPAQPKEPDKPTKPVKRKEEISQTKHDQLNRLADRYSKAGGFDIPAERSSKKSDLESQLHTKLDALNKSRDFVKDGHYILDTDYDREKKQDRGSVRLMQPLKQNLTYPRAPTNDGYSSDYKPDDFKVGSDMVKVGDTIEFSDGDRGRTEILVSGFDYGGDEWEGPSVSGYVTHSSNTNEHPKYQQKGHGDHRVSDVRRIVSSSNTKMKEGTRESYSSIINILNEAEFKEEDHPRDKGKFTSKGGGGKKEEPAERFKQGAKVHDRFDSMSSSEKIDLLMDAGGYDFEGASDIADASFFKDIDPADQEEIVKLFNEQDETKDKSQKREQTQDKLYKLEPKGDTLSDRHLEDRLNLLTDSQKDDIFEQIKGDHDMSDHGGPSTNASMEELRSYFRMDKDEWSNTLLKYSTMYDNEPIPDPYDLDSMDKARDRIGKEQERLKTVTDNAEKEYNVTKKLANKLSKSKSEFERNHGEKITKDAYWSHKHWSDKLDEITKIANNHKELSKKALTKSYSNEQAGAGGGGAGGAGAGGAGAGGNGAGAPTGNGGEPTTNGNGEPEEEEPSRRIFFGYGRYRKNCPKGQVYKNGKCVDQAEEAKTKKSFSDMTDRELEELGDDESNPKRGSEGGRGSGKRGHAGWMRSLEEAGDYNECPNCKVMTEQYGGKCQLCGKKV